MPINPILISLLQCLLIPAFMWIYCRSSNNNSTKNLNPVRTNTKKKHFHFGLVGCLAPCWCRINGMVLQRKYLYTVAIVAIVATQHTISRPYNTILLWLFFSLFRRVLLPSLKFHLTCTHTHVRPRSRFSLHTDTTTRLMIVFVR